MGIFVNECRLFAILIWKEDNVVGTLVDQAFVEGQAV